MNCANMNIFTIACARAILGEEKKVPNDKKDNQA